MLKLRLPLTLWLIGLVLLLAACGGDDPAAKAGDPLPNARAGLVAMYSGDLEGVDRYFCDEIILSIRRYANENGLGNGSISFGEDITFSVVDEPTPTYRMVAMIGSYSLTRYDRSEEHIATPENRILIGLKVEDEMWKICDLGADDPLPTDTP